MNTKPFKDMTLAERLIFMDLSFRNLGEPGQINLLEIASSLTDMSKPERGRFFARMLAEAVTPEPVERQDNVVDFPNGKAK